MVVPASPNPDPRATRNTAKQARLQAIRKSKEIPRVHVLPANEDIRRVLKHPRGMAFRSTGPVDWPLDKYTQRRIADGSVTVVEEKKSEPQPQPPKPPAAA
ncbi:MAG TPA: hypothetical protein VGI65_16835 [Steroidobacteraceae bacterium]|jgi:hypothetical protein